MKYRNNSSFLEKTRFSPDFLFEGEGVSFFYTYIRKNASTSFKKLFQALYPEMCAGELPSIGCMAEHIQVRGLTPEEIDKRFATKLFVYRDPVARAFSVYKNKLVQQDGAQDLLIRLEAVVGRDPGLLTFDEFVYEYLVLLETERWEEVDGHLYPQVWHLQPITYNKVIRIDGVYEEMCKLLPANLCDLVFKEPSNSTMRGSIPLPWADPDCPAVYFRKKYAESNALPSLEQVLRPATEARLREVYADDYRMVAEVEGWGSRLNEWEDWYLELGGALYDQIKRHLRERDVHTALQFEFSQTSFMVANAMKELGQGQLLCVVEPAGDIEILLRRIKESGLDGFVSIQTASVVEWQYNLLKESHPAFNQWFPDSLLQSFPQLDWVIVDGPDWQGRPECRYPALPSVIDRLAFGAEVWVLGGEDFQVRSVVDQWCSNFAVSTESALDGRVLKVRV